MLNQHYVYHNVASAQPFAQAFVAARGNEAERCLDKDPARPPMGNVKTALGNFIEFMANAFRCWVFFLKASFPGSFLSLKSENGR